MKSSVNETRSKSTEAVQGAITGSGCSKKSGPPTAAAGNCLVRLRKKKSGDQDGNVLGFEWIEIVAVFPRRYRRLRLSRKQMVNRGVESCSSVTIVDNDFLCKTEAGVVMIDEGDFWSAEEFYQVVG